MLKEHPPEDGEDVNVWAELVRQALAMSTEELELAKAQGELLSKGELADHVSTMQAALREGWRRATSGGTLGITGRGR